MSTALLSAAVLSFREAFEALLIVVLVSVTLVRLGRPGDRVPLLAGSVLAVAAGVGLGVLVLGVYGGFPEKTLFEAVSALVAAVLITTVVYWMARVGSRLGRELTARVALIGSSLGLASFGFIVVFREVVETVLFITPFLVSAPMDTVAGIVAGVAGAAGLSLAMHLLGLRLDIRLFFRVTSVLLLLVASGLVGYSVHELIEWFEERGVELGWIAEKAYDLGLDETHPLHHKQPLGAVLAVLTGYAVYMEWGRLLAQSLLLAIGVLLLQRAYTRP